MCVSASPYCRMPEIRVWLRGRRTHIWWADSSAIKERSGVHRAMIPQELCAVFASPRISSYLPQLTMCFPVTSGDKKSRTPKLPPPRKPTTIACIKILKRQIYRENYSLQDCVFVGSGILFASSKITWKIAMGGGVPELLLGL